MLINTNRRVALERVAANTKFSRKCRSSPLALAARAAVSTGFRPRYFPARFANAIPSRWRSRIAPFELREGSHDTLQKIPHRTILARKSQVFLYQAHT